VYCFHGMVDDEFQSNIQNRSKVEAIEPIDPKDRIPTEAEYLSVFEASGDQRFAGDAPDVLQATWRYSREVQQPVANAKASDLKNPAVGSEAYMLQKNYDPDSPRKFTRLHLVNAKGMRALTAKAGSIKDPIIYRFTNLMIRRTATDEKKPLETVFGAIIEPFTGEPFIASVRSLPVGGADQGWQSPVAIEVNTISGRNDVNFASIGEDRNYQIGATQGDLKISGQYAFISRDKDGLFQATLTGGTALEASDVRVRTVAANRIAKIASVDYSKKTFSTDVAWPATTRPGLIDIRSEGGPASSYTPIRIENEKNGSRFILAEGADAYRSRILRIDPQENFVDAVMSPALGSINGGVSNVVATNDTATKFWRAYVYSSDMYLRGEQIKEGDFPGNVLRLWEYGPGDTIRHATSVSLRRTGQDNLFELSTDVGVTIEFRASKIDIAEDVRSFVKVSAISSDGWISLSIEDQKLPAQAIMFRVVK
jgi:hypothetical protein